MDHLRGGNRVVCEQKRRRQHLPAVDSRLTNGGSREPSENRAHHKQSDEVLLLQSFSCCGASTATAHLKLQLHSNPSNSSAESSEGQNVRADEGTSTPD